MTEHPLLAVSPDSKLLACVAEDRIALLDTATLTLVRNGDAPLDARGVAFVGAGLLAIGTIDSLHTFDVATLAETTAVGIPGGSTIAAVAGDRLALLVPGGLGVARCVGPAIALTGMATPAPVDVVVGLDGERLLLAMSHRTEIVAAASQRVLSRLAATLPGPPRIAGLAGQRRYVWCAHVGAPLVTVLRLSDGRTFDHPTAAPVVAVHGHAEAPWIVVVLDGGALVRVHVQTQIGHAVEADASFAACVGAGDEAALYWIAPAPDLRFMRTMLGGDAVAPDRGTGLQIQMGPRDTAAVRRATPMPVTVIVAEPDAEADAVSVADSVPVPVAVPVRVPVPVPVPVLAPVPARSPARSPITASAPIAAPASGSGTVAARLAARSTSSAPKTWRPALADWARAVLADPTAPVGMPVLDGTPVDALATRLRLPTPGYRGLALLYGAWLTGGARPSLDRVGRTIAWEEIGGDGALPRAQLTTVVGGKIALRPAVARFLDEAAPLRIEIVGEQARRDLPSGRRRAHVSSLVAPLASARELAVRFGAAAIIDEARAGGRRGLSAALDEAWLRRLPLIAVPSGGLDVDTLAAAPLRRDHALVVVWPDRDAPPAIEDWAIVEDASGS